MLSSPPTTTVTIGNPSATLSCELYGYLTRQPPTITWNFGSDVLMNDSVFTITVQDGSHMIQNGGDTPRPSMRSVLTINRPNRTHEGSYNCSVSGDFSGLRTITLQVMEGRSIAKSSNTVVYLDAIILSATQKLYTMKNEIATCCICIIHQQALNEIFLSHAMSTTHRHGHINRAPFGKHDWTCLGIAIRSSSSHHYNSDNNSCSGDSCPYACSTRKKERRNLCTCIQTCWTSTTAPSTRPHHHRCRSSTCQYQL